MRSLGTVWLSPLLRGTEGSHQGVNRALFFLELSVLFQAHIVIGRKQFLVILRLRLFTCWLSSGTYTQLRSPVVLATWPSHSKAACFFGVSRTAHFFHLWPPGLLLEGLPDWVRPTKDNQSLFWINLKSNWLGTLSTPAKSLLQFCHILLVKKQITVSTPCQWKRL